MCLPVYEIRVYIVAATKHVWKKLCYTCRAPLVPPTHLGGGERFRFHIVIISLRKIDEKQYTLELHKAWIIFLVSWLEVGGSCAFMTKVTTLPESPETCPSTPSAWFTNLYWVGLRTDMGLGIGLWIHQNLQSGARPNKWLITAMC